MALKGEGHLGLSSRVCCEESSKIPRAALAGGQLHLSLVILLEQAEDVAVPPRGRRWAQMFDKCLALQRQETGG
jgi:hypothetical protein